MLKEKIKPYLEEFLGSRPDIFLMQFEVSPANEVNIVIDGDKGVSVKDCLDLSRKIENNVDRDEEDYGLKVSSYGVSEPLLRDRQFKKNIGRKIKIDSKGKAWEGTIDSADDDGVTIKWKERVPKKTGKGKVTEEFEKKILYKNIDKAKVKITF